MRLLCLGLVVGLAVGLTADTVGAVTLDFEDLWDGTKDNDPIPDGYAGFDWSDYAYWESVEYISSWLPNGFVNTWEGDVGIFTAYSNPISMSGPVFDFNGARVGAAWNLGQEVTFEGWLDADLLYSQTLTLGTQGQEYVFDFIGINTLWIRPDVTTGTKDPAMHSAGAGHHIAMDNFVINETRVPTPEPGTLALLGLVGIPAAAKSLRRRWCRN
ncbi:MAG TPA: PEP-CTERM sorting domain-containing protein [Armatimonadota bacterium]|nr:PEP-CTERM sorting domain-containing protein [Armatimonadota bacterium]HQK92496.1 PEP-CTERM sorting domain-containing protein [Armatimonadota bacterium]